MHAVTEVMKAPTLGSNSAQVEAGRPMASEAVSGKTIRLEINADTLQRLLALNAICATEFHCLDCQSKSCVWELFLRGCAQRCEV